MEEKFWIGIEKIHKNIIFFHKYSKPDMPGHKEILAYSISDGRVIWTNDDYSYLFIYDNKVFCFKQQFEGRRYFTLNYLTGDFIEDLGNDAAKVNAYYDKAREAEDYSSYIFPETGTPLNKNAANIIGKLKSKLDIIGEVEYNICNNSLFTSFHTRVFEKSMINKFAAFNLESGEEEFTETLSLNTQSLKTDSFFVYDTYLFLLKDKTELLIHKIE